MGWIDDVLGVASVTNPFIAGMEGVAGNKSAGSAFAAVDSVLDHGGQFGLDLAEFVPGMGAPLSAAEAVYHAAHGAYDLGTGNTEGAIEEGATAGMAAINAILSAGGGGDGMVANGLSMAYGLAPTIEDGASWAYGLYQHYAE